MPYASQAQERFFHTDTARKKGISQATVHEFDQASKGMSLPKHVSSKPVEHQKDPLKRTFKSVGGY